MPRISNVTCGELRYGYLFDIQSPLELEDWFLKVQIPSSQEDFSEALQGMEGRKHKNTLCILAEIRGVSLLDQLSKLNADRLRGMQRAIDDRGRIFVNSLSGYFAFHDKLEITETHEIKDWWLPEEKLRIIQWPDGKHFYAKVGKTDVVFDGVQKWDTKKEAETAGKKFLGKT